MLRVVSTSSPATSFVTPVNRLQPVDNDIMSSQQTHSTTQSATAVYASTLRDSLSTTHSVRHGTSTRLHYAILSRRLSLPWQSTRLHYVILSLIQHNLLYDTTHFTAIYCTHSNQPISLNQRINLYHPRSDSVAKVALFSAVSEGV